MSLAILKILPAAVITFWAFRIFFRKDVFKMQLLMVIGMLMSVMTLFVWEETALFMFPFFFLAIHGMTSAGSISKWYWLILLPSIVFIPFKGTPAFPIFLMLQVTALSVWSVIKVSRFNRLLSECYDNSGDISDGLNQIVMYLIATIVVIVVTMILPDDVLAVTWIAIALSLFISVLQFLIGDTVYNMKEMPLLAEETVVSDKTLSEDTTTGTKADDGKPAVYTPEDALLQRVIDEKLYLNPMISLVSLAEELHTNRTYLSNGIHSCYNQNFSDFINTLRIKYALELMKAGGEDVNIKDVALKSGYNHIQSFYRNFTLIMETTPKAWLSKQ